MDYIVKCFNVINSWDESNLYPAVIATPKSILDFSLPNSISVDINKKSSDFSTNSLTLSNYGSINGSISYLYSSSNLKNVFSSANISLQDAVNTYQFVDSLSVSSHNQLLANSNRTTTGSTTTNNNALLYGKLNFPSNILEALIIKNFDQHTRLLVKCLSTNSNFIKNHGILTVYYQKNYPKMSNEFIYSSNEGLIGFRNLFNVNLNSLSDATFASSFNNNNNNDSSAFPNSSTYGNFNSNTQGFGNLSSSNKVFYDNSKLSIGTEIWYGILNMTPGFSNSVRYSTYSTYSGKPLTITLSLNPLIGLLSSTYTVKTSLNSTFCSKYDFNIYSYESNLSLGCELWNFNGNLNEEIERLLALNNKYNKSFKKLIKRGNADVVSERGASMSKNQYSDVYNNPHSHHPLNNNNQHKFHNFHRNDNVPKPAASQSNIQQQQPHHGSTTTNIEKFKDLYKSINYSSIVKLSTSTNDKNLKVLWEGKYKGFLVELGCNVTPFNNSMENLRDVSYIPNVSKFGISLQYNS